jgi:hypothetical protein
LPLAGQVLINGGVARRGPVWPSQLLEELVATLFGLTDSIQVITAAESSSDARFL